jgi:hypothetical protein
MRELDEKEKKALEQTVILWNSIYDLDILHPDDLNEHRRDIHNIQNRIQARVFLIKNDFKNLTNEKTN